MRQFKSHLNGQIVRTLVIVIAAFILSGCRACVNNVSTNENENGNENTAKQIPSPSPSAEGKETSSTVTADPSPSPTPTERIDRIVAWATKLNNDAWVFRNRRFDLPLSPGEDQLRPSDRVGTDQDGQAKLRFECGTIFLFHDTHLKPSPCDRSRTWSGNCLRGGALSMDVNRRTCGRKLLLGTGSAEISLDNVNASHSFKRTIQPTRIGESSSFYFPMKSTVQDQSGTTLIAYYFPRQKATLLQVRALTHGVVKVIPVTSEDNRKQAPQPRIPVFLREAQCAVLEPGLLPGPDIRGVPQRTAVACDKNFWPLLTELSQRENMTPITTENAILLTELALRRGQPVPPSELNPVLAARPREINFEAQTVGQQEIRRIEIENRGKPPLTVGTPTVDGPNPSDFAVIGNNCVQQVETKCELQIGFTPRDVGVRHASLLIPNNGAKVPSEVLLIGIGKEPATTIELKIDAAAQNTVFPIQKVGTTTTRLVTVRNTGKVAITINDITVEGAGKAAFVSKNLCSGAIPPNGSCNIEITFAPKTPELFRASLSVKATEVKLLDLTQRSVVVTGNELKGGADVPVIKLDQSRVCFGKHKAVKKSDPKVRQELSVTISNSGPVPLTISKVAASKDDFKIVRESCTARDVDANVGECRVVVGFTPRGSGLREGTLTITNDDPAHNPTNVSLKGVGKHRNLFVRVYEFFFKRTKDPCK